MVGDRDKPRPAVEPEPVCDPEYWRDRLGRAGNELHRSVFNGSIDQFNPLHRRHAKLLEGYVGLRARVLDAGCGYGRILSAIPTTWTGPYLGVDVSPDLVQVARLTNRRPDTQFLVHDLRDPPTPAMKAFDPDLIVVCSLKNMILRHLGEGDWKAIEANLRSLGGQIIYLDYGEWD